MSPNSNYDGVTDSSAWSSIGTTDYAYDDALRVTNIKHKDGSGTIQANFTYSYDLAGVYDTVCSHAALR